MVGIILASHGAFSSGIKESGQMIFGPQEDVASVVLTPEMGPDDFYAKVLEAIDTFSQKEQVLFLVDLWGGTPFNQISRLIGEHEGDGWVAVTGLNLPMVLAAYGERMGTESAADIAKAIFPEAAAGIKIKPESLQEGLASSAAPAVPILLSRHADSQRMAVTPAIRQVVAAAHHASLPSFCAIREHAHNQKAFLLTCPLCFPYRGVARPRMGDAHRRQVWPGWRFPSSS